MAEKDVIRWVLDRMIELHGSIRPEVAAAIEREARAEWGGKSINYVPKYLATDRKSRRQLHPDVVRQACEMSRGGASTDEVVEKFGLSSSSLHRLMKRGTSP